MKIERRVTKQPGIIQITCSDERWYFREDDERFFPSVTWIAGFYPKGVEFYKWLASKGWDESVAIKEAAGERGRRVHNAIEQLLVTGSVKMDDVFRVGDTDVLTELTVDEYEAVMSFHAWYNETNPEILGVEEVAYNEEYDYAGTLDLIARIGDKVWVIDLKTSQQVWPEHELQISAYRHTEVGKSHAGAILQVGYKRNKKRFKFTEVEDKFDLFLSARNSWSHETATIQPLQRDFPQSLTIPEVYHAEDRRHLPEQILKGIGSGSTDSPDYRKGHD